MRKLKLLMMALALIVGGSNSVFARTDVTNNYLTDAALENETSNWALSSNGGNHNWDGTNKYHESWHNTFTITQTTSVLPAGYYQLSIQVAVEGGNSTTISLQATSGSNASVVAYPKYSTHSSYSDMAAWWAADASHTGNRNLSRIYTTVYVEEGQTLTATFKQTAADQWFVYGQMQLHKLTDAEGQNAQCFEEVYNPLTNQDLASGRYKHRFEDYTAGTVTGKKLTKTISSLPNGKYNVTLNGGASYTSGRGFEGAVGDDKTSFFANDASTNVTVVQRTDILNSAFTDYTASNALVTDGNLQIGFNNSAIGANWFVGSVKYIELADPYLSSLASKTFTSGNTMEARQWYKFTVPTDGDYTLSVTEGVVYAEDNVFASEAKAATSTVALKAGTAYFKSATAQTLAITYVTPVVANGTYYLYDATNKMFLSRGNLFGTESSLDKYGVPFTYNNYEKSIRFKDWSDVGLYYTTNEGGAYFTDGAPSQFTFEVTDGGFYLYDKTNSVYIKHTASNQTTFGCNSLKQTASSAEATVWVIKTKDEHDAIVAEYATDNKTSVISSAGISTTVDNFETYLSENLAAKDGTSKVGTAKFTSGNGDWTFTQVENRSGATNYGADYAEMFQRTGYWSQTIRDLPQGIYKVTVNAFERGRDWSTCNTLGADGYEIVTSYFEANGQKVQLASWFSDKTDTNNPDNTTQAATAFNNDKYKIEVYTYVDSDGELTLRLNKPAFQWSSWVLFNNVTLTYYDTTVEEDDATSILSEATTAMNSPMKASLYQALATAKSTFEESKTVPNYNALRAAIDNTRTSITSYANMYTNYLQPISNYLATTNFVNQTSSAYTAYAAYKAAYENYTNAETADVENATANGLSITRGNGTNYTSTYSQLLLPNWTIDGNAALTNGSGFYVNSWSTESQGTGDAADFANPFFEKWTGSGSIPACTLEGTVTGLIPNTAYDITAKVRVDGSSKVVGSITMEVVGGVPVDVTTGEKIGETTRYIKSYTATGVTDGSGNLVLRFNVAANSNISWLSFRDINYAVNESVTLSNDFTELTTAIATAESKTLGFEADEYAPYNNINGINALSTAKAFDKTRYYVPDVITNAATALSSVEWTQNDSEMNAFYDGTFATREVQETSMDGTKIPGWTSGNNIRQILKTVAKFPGLNDATDKTALFAWSSGATYGSDLGYEMPLKADTYYRLTIKVAGWNNETRGNINVSVLKDSEGLASTSLGKADKDISTGMTTMTKVFKTGAAGNYIFSISSTNNIVFTDVELFKAVADEITIAENATEAPAISDYANVTLDRSFNAGWNAVCLPFATDAFDGAEIAEFVDETIVDNNVTLNFKRVDAFEANKPYLVYFPAAVATGKTFSGVAVAPAEVKKTGEAFDFMGTFTVKDVEAGNWVVSGGALKKASATISLKPTRTYFAPKTAGARIAGFAIDDDETTGIAVIENEGKMEIVNSAYNLNGQKMNGQLKKGVYIINGKKTVVK